MFLLTAWAIVAFVDAEVVRMILLLLPAVAVHTAVLEITAIAVSSSLLFRTPEAALLSARVLVYVRLSAIVLPVMRVLALITHMASHLVIERAPYRLEVEHVEVIVLIHLVKQVDRELFLVVRERA